MTQVYFLRKVQVVAPHRAGSGPPQSRQWPPTEQAVAPPQSRQRLPTELTFDCTGHLCLLYNTHTHTQTETPSAPHVASVTFLLTVNDTWYPEDYPNQTCLRTVKTPPLKPDQRWNESQSIAVGKCDHGPLIYTLTDEGTLLYCTWLLLLLFLLLHNHPIL